MSANRFLTLAKMLLEDRSIVEKRINSDFAFLRDIRTTVRNDRAAEWAEQSPRSF